MTGQSFRRERRRSHKVAGTGVELRVDISDHWLRFEVARRGAGGGKGAIWLVRIIALAR